MSSIFNKKNKIENTTNDDISSLSHTKWNCKYHIVFAPKYRRKIFYVQKRLVFTVYFVVIVIKCI